MLFLCVAPGTTAPLPAAQGSWDNETLTYDGSGLGLMEVPDDIPVEVVFIDLSDNNIENITSWTFLKYENCSVLELSSNKLSVLEENAFNGLASLKTLSLNSNNIDRLQEGTFRGLGSVDSLNLISNQIESIEADAFFGLSNLAELNLQGQGLTGAGIESGAFNGLSSLKTLALNSNNIGRLNKDTFLGLGSVTDLNLGRNDIQTLKSGSFEGLSSLPKLDLSYQALTQLPRNTFTGLNALTDLDLEGNKIPTIQENTFDGLNSLLYLNLQTDVRTMELGSLNGMGKLRTLLMGGNSLKEFKPQFFSPTGVSDKLALDVRSTNPFNCGDCLCWLTVKTANGEITDIDGGSNLDKICNVPSSCDYASAEDCDGLDHERVCDDDDDGDSGVHVDPSALLITTAVLLLLTRLW